MQRTLAFAAAAITLCAATFANAETLKINSNGLDIGTAAGAKAYYTRLKRAVSDGCGGAPAAFLGSEEERYQTCFKDGMDQAMAQLQGAPLVVALHTGKAPKTTQLAAR